MDLVDHIVSVISAVLICILIIPLCMASVRMLIGPGYADRFIAFDMLTAIAVSIMALTASTTGYRGYLDIAFGLAIIGFVGTCAVAMFLERKGGKN